MDQHDPKALAVAKAVSRREQPEFAILFGSRARGDYREPESDIDVMLVLEAEPDDAGKESAIAAAAAEALKICGRETPVQLVWRTPEDFRQNRRYINSVETAAAREGIVMPRNPEEYRAADYEDDETEIEYSWANYDERVRCAESHLRVFEILDDLGEDDLMIAQRAHSALEHGMKALIAAHGATYGNTHNLGHLIGTIRRTDPELASFSLGISPDVYSEYAGENEYKTTRKTPLLTEHTDYREKTASDIRFIIEQAREVQQEARNRN